MDRSKQRDIASKGGMASHRRKLEQQQTDGNTPVTPESTQGTDTINPEQLMGTDNLP